MSKKPIGTQVSTINPYSPFIQQSFDLKKIDQQAVSAGVEFTHWKAMPSPIGLKDRGDWRRNDGGNLDILTSNGMLYHCCGRFTSTMVSNDRSKKWSDGGESDPSMARLILPRFYNKPGSEEQADGDRIRMAPGDRIYIADTTVDDLVSDYHKMDYEAGVDNVAHFPIVKLEVPIVDSRNISYTCGVDYQITPAGNIRWIDGGRNPGIDPETQSGRIYSVRFLYRSYYYVVALPKEVRIAGITTDGVRTTERMPFQASIVREYIYHNVNRGDQQNALKPKDPARAVNAPAENTNPEKYSVPVDMSNISDD